MILKNELVIKGVIGTLFYEKSSSKCSNNPDNKMCMNDCYLEIIMINYSKKYTNIKKLYLTIEYSTEEDYKPLSNSKLIIKSDSTCNN